MTAPKTDRVSTEMLEMAFLLSKHQVLSAQDLGRVKALCTPHPVRTIHNKKEYAAALHEIEQLWSAPAKSAEADRLDVLSILVEHYEKSHFPMADPDPIELIEHVMESRGLSRKDLEPMIGPRGRVADILNRTRPLTLEMIRRLVTQLDLPADVLVQPYALREE